MGHWLDDRRSNYIGDPNTPIQYTSLVDLAAHPLQAITPATSAAAPKINKNAYSNIVAKGDYAAKVWKALIDAGFPGSSIDYVFAQCYMESAHWTSGPAIKDNNPGNIMTYGSWTKGTYIPSNKTYVIHFKDLNEFAGELYKTLSKGANPLGASTLEDYVHRLKVNKYYGDESEASYLGKMQAAMSALDKSNDAYFKKYQDQEIAKAHPGGWWGKLNLIEKGGIIAGGALFTIIIFKVASE